MNRRTTALVALFSVLLVASLVVPAALADEETEPVTDLSTNHDLDTSEAVSAFNNRGEATADISRLDMTVTVAEKKGDVGLEDHLFPTNVRNDYVRFEYHEEADRTVRILVPEDYWTPYLREEVEAINADHTAEFRSVRGGDYTEIVVRFDGPADVVFPVDKVASLSYTATAYVDSRLNNSIGITFREDNSKWEYVNDSALVEGPGFAVGESPGDITVQYDATPDSPSETWINAPHGETLSDDIYYYERGSEGNSSAYIVSKTDDPPAVRYNVDSTFTDRIRGDLNDLRQVPNRIMELLGVGGD